MHFDISMRAQRAKTERVRGLRPGRDLLRPVPLQRWAAAWTSSATSTSRCSPRASPRCSSRCSRTPSACPSTGAFRSPPPPSTISSTCATVTGVVPRSAAVDPRLVAATFPVVTRSVGQQRPADRRAQRATDLKRGVAHRLRDRLHRHVREQDHWLDSPITSTTRNDNINFITDPLPQALHGVEPAPGLAAAAGGAGAAVPDARHLPARRVHLLEPGKLRNQGFEASIDHSFNRSLSALRTTRGRTP